MSTFLNETPFLIMLMNRMKNGNVLLDARETAHIRAMIATGKRKIKALVIKIKSTQDAVEKRRLCMEIDSIEREFQKEYRKVVASALEHACQVMSASSIL